MHTPNSLASLLLKTVGAGLCALSTTGLGAAHIQVTDFKTTQIDDNHVQVTLAAEGQDVEIGSFVIRMDDAPEGFMPKGFQKHSNNYVYLTDRPSRNSPNLTDNGPRDEDSETNRFTYTFDTSDWDDGRYFFLIAAQNRPHEGSYVVGARGFPITIGEVAEVEKYPTVDQTVYLEKDIYACFPDLLVQPDGSLSTGFGTRVMRSHIDPRGGSLTMRSTDNGDTWEVDKSGVRVDHRWKAADGSYVIADARGWIHVDASELQRLEKEHRFTMRSQPGKVAYLGGAVARTSHDGGKTWQRRDIEMPDNILGLMTYHIGSTHLVTSKGARLTAVYGYRYQPGKPNGRGLSEVFIIRSDDDGKTWSVAPMYPDGLPDPLLGFDEVAVEEAADGTLVMMMRTTQQKELYQSNSTDDGKTWSAPVKTNIWGYPADLLRLSNGDLLCTYGYRRAPMGIRAVISRDNGKTWDIENEMILRADSLGDPSDVGYPQTFERPDGSILAIYYITDNDNNTHVATSVFNPDQKN